MFAKRQKNAKPSLVDAGDFLFLKLKLPKDDKKAYRTVALAIHSSIKESNFLFSYETVKFPDGRDYVFIWLLKEEEIRALSLNKKYIFSNYWYHLANQVFKRAVNSEGHYHLFISIRDKLLSVSYINCNIVDLKLLPPDEDKERYLVEHLENFYDKHRFELTPKGLVEEDLSEVFLDTNSLIIKRKTNFSLDGYARRYIILAFIGVCVPILLGMFFSFLPREEKSQEHIEAFSHSLSNISPIYEDLITFLIGDWHYEGNGKTGVLTINLSSLAEIEDLKNRLIEAEHIKHFSITNLEIIGEKAYRLSLELST